MTQLHICARSFWRAWASPTSCITLYIHPGLSPYTFTLGYHPRLLYHPINRFIDKSTISLIFKGLVRPHLEYAAPIWNPHLEKQKEAIENVQRRATKLIPGLFHMSYPDRLKELNLPTLTYRRARGDMIQVFKLLSNNDCYDKALPNILKSCNTGLRGHKFKLFQEGANKYIKKFSFTNKVTKHWNRLPEEVVNANNLIQFEKRLDNFWKNQDILHDYKSELKYNHTDDP